MDEQTKAIEGIKPEPRETLYIKKFRSHMRQANEKLGTLLLDELHHDNDGQVDMDIKKLKEMRHKMWVTQLLPCEIRRLRGKFDLSSDDKNARRQPFLLENVILNRVLFDRRNL